MRFLQRDKVKKTYIVISDLHLSAGVFIDGKRNVLEEFHDDKELVDFLKFYSTGTYDKRPVELIINGDFLDFLAVPYVNYFDDEFWSEKATKEKLQHIINAHHEVIDALGEFANCKNKNVVYIIGNHDGELAFSSIREDFKKTLKLQEDDSFLFIFDNSEYIPIPGVVIKHGHQYEKAHSFNPSESLITAKGGQAYFSPPWGSYYVTRIVNKFKEERGYIGAIKPIRILIAYGLFFDTLFTIRFLFASTFYFFMVRFIRFFKAGKKMLAREFFKDLLESVAGELELFRDYGTLANKFFENRPEVKALIVGHTHEAEYTEFPGGAVFINTGTWTKFYQLDFTKLQIENKLTYAQIDEIDQSDHIDMALNSWKGTSKLPYDEYF